MKSAKYQIYKSPRFLGSLAFLITLSVGFFLSYTEYQLNLLEENEKTEQIGEQIEDRIKGVISQARTAVNILGFLVKTNKIEQNYSEVGKSIIENIDIIDQIQYTNKGVIVSTYPLLGNEDVIGYDILADSSRSEEAFLAISRKEIFFAGPVPLRQGGEAILARQPIFVNGEFRGFAVGLISWQKFKDHVFTNLKGDSGFTVDLLKISPDGSQKTSLLSGDFSKANGTSFETLILEGNWLIKIQHTSSEALSSILPGLVLRVILAFIFGYLIYNLANQPKKLSEQVRRKTKALRLSNKRFELATKATSEVIWDWDLVKGHTFRSENFDKLFGYERSSELERDDFWKSKIHPDDVNNVEKNLKEALEGNGDIWTQEFRFLKSDGELITVIDKGLIIRNKEGKAIRVVGSTQDITARKRAELNLSNQRQRLSNVIEATQAGTWEWNVQTGETIFNETWAEIVGYTLEELEPINIQTWKDLAHPEDLKNSKKRLNDYFEGKSSSYEFEYRMLHKKGHWVWVSDKGKVFTWTEDGKPLLMFGTHIDITEKVTRDQEILNANIKLKSVNEELKSFASVASHDMKEPLRMISSFLQLLEKKYTPVLDEKGIQYINFAINGAKRLSSLIDDMLEYSRIGFDPELLAPVNLNLIVEEVLILKKDLIDEKKAIITVKKMPNIVGIKTPIKSVFINLIANALKYQKNDAIPIISIYSRPIGEFVQVTVEDNGIGIDEAYFEKVFTIFSRLHNRDEYTGTGMGLAICKKVITQHGGNIWLESTENGSKFHFTLKIYGHKTN